jgi:hypothetical protein
VSPEKSEKREISIGILSLIEIYSKREKLVKVVDIKPGEMKVIPLNDGELILYRDDNTKKLRYAIFDKKKLKLKEVGEIF